MQSLATKQFKILFRIFNNFFFERRLLKVTSYHMQWVIPYNLQKYKNKAKNINRLASNQSITVNCANCIDIRTSIFALKQNALKIIAALRLCLECVVAHASVLPLEESAYDSWVSATPIPACFIANQSAQHGSWWHLRIYELATALPQCNPALIHTWVKQPSAFGTASTWVDDK